MNDECIALHQKHLERFRSSIRGKARERYCDVFNSLCPRYIGRKISSHTVVFSGGQRAGLVVFLRDNNTDFRLSEEFQPILAVGDALVLGDDDDAISFEGDSAVFVCVEQRGSAAKAACERAEDIGDDAAAAPAFDFGSFSRLFRVAICNVKVVHVGYVEISDEKQAITIVPADYERVNLQKVKESIRASVCDNSVKQVQGCKDGWLGREVSERPWQRSI